MRMVPRDSVPSIGVDNRALPIQLGADVHHVDLNGDAEVSALIPHDVVLITRRPDLVRYLRIDNCASFVGYASKRNILSDRSRFLLRISRCRKDEMLFVRNMPVSNEVIGPQGVKPKFLVEIDRLLSRPRNRLLL